MENILFIFKKKRNERWASSSENLLFLNTEDLFGHFIEIILTFLKVETRVLRV